MEEFSRSYIDKCILHQEIVQYLIERSRGLFQDGSRSELHNYFQEGDLFYCPDLMSKSETKRVKSVIGQYFLEADDPTVTYPVGKCIYIPTEAQLAIGIKATHIHLAANAYGHGPEHLLDCYLEHHNAPHP